MDEIEDRFWKSYLEQLAAVEAEAPTRDQLEARMAELRPKIAQAQAEKQRALIGMLAIVEFAEKEGLPNAADLRAAFTQVQREEEHLARLGEKADRVAASPKLES